MMGTGYARSAQYCQSSQNYTNILSESNAQRKELRESRIKRDITDVEKLLQWLTAHFPFSQVSTIMYLSSGIQDDETVNCHQGFSCEKEAILAIIGSNFRDVKFKICKPNYSTACILNFLHFSHFHLCLIYDFLLH